MLIEQSIEDQVGAPLEFSLRLDESLHVRGKINNHARTRLIEKILMGLNKKDQQALKESCFGPIVQLGDNLKFSSQFIHYMLQREVVTKKRKEMWFCIQGHMLRYSIVEFRHVTGLNCGKIPSDQGDDVDMEQAIGKPKCTLEKLEGYYTVEDKNSKCKLKMALLLILEGILMARDRTNTVRQLSINLVHDLDRFNAYPWGRLVYLETLDGLQRGVLRGNNNYNLYGFPLAFQIWAFEALPDLARILAKINKPQLTPLCLKWVSSRVSKKMPTYAEMKESACKPLRTFNSILSELDEDMGWNEEEEEEDDQIVEFLRRGCPRVSLIVNDTQVQGETNATTNEIDETSAATWKRRQSDIDDSNSDSVVGSKRRKIISKGKRNTLIRKNNTTKMKNVKSNHVLIEEENSVHSASIDDGQRATGGVVPKQTVDVEGIVTTLFQKLREDEPLWAKQIRERMDKLLQGSVPKSIEKIQEVQQEQIRDHMDNLQSVHESLTKSIDKIQDIQQELLERFENAVVKQDEDVHSILREQRNILVMCQNLEQRVNVVLMRVNKFNNASQSQRPSTTDVAVKNVPNKKDLTSTVVGIWEGKQDLTQLSKGVIGVGAEKNRKEVLDLVNYEEVDREVEVGGEEPHTKEAATRITRAGRISKPSKVVKESIKEETSRKAGSKNKISLSKMTKNKIPVPPKHSFLSTQEREHFYSWYNANSKANDFIRGYSSNCLQREWFTTILEEDGLLHSQHIEEMLCHIRKAILKNPENFADVAVLPDWWAHLFNKAVYEAFCRVGSGSYEFDDKLYKVVDGELPSPFGKVLNNVNRIYAPFNIKKQLWIALEIDLLSWKINVFDSFSSFTEESELKSCLEPLSVMLPQFLKTTGKFDRFAHEFKHKPNLAINRRHGLASQAKSGSCGIYTVKYIEFLSSGRIGFPTISDDYIRSHREQIAYAIMRNQWSWPFDKDHK